MAKYNDAYKLSVECFAIVVVLLVSGFIASLNADEFLSEHYLGCFYNNGSQKEYINSSEILNNGNQTFEQCIQHCKAELKSYARLQNGSYCECLDELGLQVNDSLCNTTCEENPTQRCGGTMHTFFPTYVLYTVCPFGTYGPQCQNACHCKRGSFCNKNTGNCPNGCHGNYTGRNCSALKSLSEQYIGCYKDNNPKRALPYAAVNTQTRTSMSWQRCTNLCSSKNYSFSGTQWSSQCFCGESYDRHGRLNELNCNMKCTGSEENCGAGGANSVLHTCPSGFYGLNCAKVCNCQTGRCFFYNGTCQVGDCESGWTGNACSLRDCSVNNGGCEAGELCVTVEPIVNRTISVCRCPDGYGKVSTGGNCTDVDECSEIPDICGPYSRSCSNTEGSYTCHCQNGNNITASICTSGINECADYPGICGPYGKSCVNTEGGFTCHCLNGSTVENSSCSSDVLLEHYLGCFHNNGTLWENRTERGNLRGGKFLECGNRTFEQCIEHCKESNGSYSYARMQSGSYCECVDESGLQANDSLCNKTCEEISVQRCNGMMNGLVPVDSSFNLLPTYFLYAVCPFGTYGSQCEKTCHCEREAPCDRKTGKCPVGCHRSYSGKACNTTKSFPKQYIGCYRDYVGLNRSRAMPYATAVFPDRYRPMSLQRCTDLCSSANYSFSGAQYSYECFCGESYEKYGNLSEERCSFTCSGNRNEFCGGPFALSVYHSCPSGNYGRNCAKVCNCKEGRCFFQNGTCQVNGCKPGWTGNTCALRDCNVNNGSCDAGDVCVMAEPIVNRTISVCRCPDGYGKTTTGTICTDIDECLLFPGICGIYSRSCSNNEGSYTCHCQNGEITTASACTSETDKSAITTEAEGSMYPLSVVIIAAVGSGVGVAIICLLIGILFFIHSKRKRLEQHGQQCDEDNGIGRRTEDANTDSVTLQDINLYETLNRTTDEDTPVYDQINRATVGK